MTMRQRICDRLTKSLFWYKTALVFCCTTLVAWAQDPVETGKTIGGLTGPEILGVVCVALVIAVVYKDRTVYARLEGLVEKNIATQQDVKDALYADAITRAELAKTIEHCRAVQEERNRQEIVHAANQTHR